MISVDPIGSRGPGVVCVDYREADRRAAPLEGVAMDWDTEPNDLPEPDHGWVAQDHDPDLGSGGYGSGGDEVYVDESHNTGSGPIHPQDEDDEQDPDGRSHALPVDTDGDGDYDRILVDRDGDGDYDRAIPYGDDGPGRR
jgi:hypothetical protein